MSRTAAVVGALLIAAAAQAAEPAATDGAAPDDELSEDLNEETALIRRRRLEQRSELNPFVLSPHRPNYILPISYQGSPNPESSAGTGLAQRLEMKLQISLKVPAVLNVFGSGGDLYFAYTGLSYWQAYDEERSRPFRETNHEPEMFMSFPVDWKVFAWRLDAVEIGINHQSNGGDVSRSRSWNRVIANFIWEFDDLMVSLRPWWRFPEDPKSAPDDPLGDDNPDIEHYVGQFETVVAWRRGSSTYSAVWRNSARIPDNRGSLEASWSFPMGSRSRGYVQYFNGYGESLIDYDHHQQRLGIGVLLTDWL